MPDVATAPRKPWAGRREDCTMFTITLDTEAADLLRQYCPEGRRNIGTFVARLVYEHRARQEERQRVHQRLEELCAAD